MQWSPHAVTLRQLQYLLAVADRLSFRAAAEVCHVAQPSLSAQVAQAERAIGVQVFERDNKRVLVTPAGREVLAYAKRVLTEADALELLARSLGDAFAGTLRVGVIPTIAPYLLPVAAPKLRESFPRLTILWVEEKTPNIVTGLDSGALDAAIVALEAELPELAQVVIGHDDFVLAAAAGHRLAQERGPVKIEALDGESVLLLDDGHCFRTQVLAACARSSMSEADFRATSMQTLVQVAATGHGVTLLPAMALAVENRTNALVVRPFAKPPSRTIALVWRPSSPLGAVFERVGEVLRG